MLKPGGVFATSTWYHEAWVDDVRCALSVLPGNPPFPSSSREMICCWGQGPMHEPNYVKSLFHARGFGDVKVELHSDLMPMYNAEDFCDIYTVFLDGIAARYWTKAETETLMPLVKPAIIKFLNNKYGEGKQFTTERISVMASGRKPLWAWWW